MSSVAKSEFQSPIREVRLRVAACFALIMLSWDSINPVKVVCTTLGVDTFYAGILFSLGFVVIVSTNAKELTYFLVKVFFHSILSIFLSSIEVLGRENIPIHGPIIFTGNHMNQFVDGAVLVATIPQKVSFLVAEKSYNKRIIGDLMKSIGAIPVSRPQDKAHKGPGKIMFEGLKMKGEGTQFTKLQKGDRIRPAKSADGYRIKNVISDTEAVLAETVGESSPLLEVDVQKGFVNYDLLEHVDQSRMFDKVQYALSQGSCLGIFPEGGSHDRTDLLPLKAGIAAIAFGVKEKYGISVPIVPVGLNYFRGHRFRGRCVVEFGSPISITPEMMETYTTSRSQGYQDLLHDVSDAMRSVIVTASDYGELRLIHTARRLYQRSSMSLSTKQKQDLARRLSVGWRIIKEKYGENLPGDLVELKRDLEKYQDMLDHWGLKDYQIQSSMSELTFGRTLYTFFHGTVIILLASIPSLLLNAPVGIIAHYYAHIEAKKDLLASRVKLAAKDVLLSKKIVFCLIGVPILWIAYCVLMLLFTPWQRRTIVVVTLSFPLFSYLGIMAVEASMHDLKDLRPAFLRLLPSFRKVAHELPNMRSELSNKIHNLVKKYGPELGAVYMDTSANWEQAARKTSVDQIAPTATDLEHASQLLNSITSMEEQDNEETVKKST